MSIYFLDTNIVLRFCNTLDDRHLLTTTAVAQLLRSGHDCVFTAQILAEFWVVATRSPQVNGLGFPPSQTREFVNALCETFHLLEETPQTFQIWLELVTGQNVRGKRAHDVRIAAAMLTHGITNLLTFNTQDFVRISGITAIAPQRITTKQN
ncbi:type II toxin-antitoxin system VapC family toxin [Oscillatoria sp. CS-180]|uniref:type II toxin-antitoxin system VapC family toxin n=1 Tax=Oscillatoria sp. CS-180 TaxID=3021720 RepID=UPI00232B9F8C|nr:type II toxin-antitoxin system VapC family toxin [Oscillatoria sp. CS-180]MDB9526110.1 type II toxin-antitoxin system VapC family toxin [Oscillatoria sp. CS-180]